MNTKKIASVALLTVTLLTTAQSALALDLSKVQVKFSEQINQDCLGMSGYDPVWGCARNEYVAWPGHVELKVVPTIYLQTDIPSTLFSYVFLHNLGQLIGIDYSDEELVKVFNPAPTKDMSAAIRRDVGNSFAFWVMGGKLTPAKLDFFRTALLK